MRFTLGISPCPNDTFIFDALINKKIDTGDIEFDVQLEDVEALNQWALQGEMDVSKISYGTLPGVMHTYSLLKSGGALGKGVGPLLIAPPALSGNEIKNEEINSFIHSSIIAIPGMHTTAHILFSLAFPQAVQKKFMVFDEIENFVLEGNKDEKRAGVIIHENRFTYQQKGLQKLMDLGENWETQTGLPVPLGGIVARKDIDKNMRQKIDSLIRKSLEYAFENYKEKLPPFVTMHAQEMDENVMWRHVNLYVNNYSLDPGSDGTAAIVKFFEVFSEISKGQYTFTKEQIFDDTY